MVESRFAIGLVGSPRKDGHTALIVRHALQLLEGAGFRTEEVSFGGAKIVPCGTSCDYNCSRQPVKCPVDDDASKIYELIRRADLIVVGSPVYGGLLPSVMYAFKERGQGLADNWPITGKDIVLLLNCRWGCERPMHDLERFFGAKSRIVSKAVIAVSSREKLTQLPCEERDKVRRSLSLYLGST